MSNHFQNYIFNQYANLVKFLIINKKKKSNRKYWWFIQNSSINVHAYILTTNNNEINIWNW